MKIQIIFKHDGTWDDVGNYINYKKEGMLLPCDASYIQLCEKLSKHMQMDNNINAENLNISYRMEGDSTPIWISNDWNLEFYVDLKKNVKDASKYPLIVERERNTMATQTSISTNLNLMEINRAPTTIEEFSYTQIETMNLRMPYLENMTEFTETLVENIVNYFEENTMIEESDDDNIHSDENRVIKWGNIFNTKVEAQKAITHHALLSNFNFRVDKSSPTKYYVKCINKSCPWLLHTSRISQTSAFKGNILSIRSNSNSRRYQGQIWPHIDYHKVWRAKEKIYEKVIGKFSRSYGDLPSYFFMVNKNNPGSLTELQTTADGYFLYAFMALSSSIEGWKYCRPQVVVDGAFLSSAYGGTLLTACTYNAAGGILPLAFAIVDSENNESYNWFFRLFRQAYGVREEMCIISDRHESTGNAVRNVYPEVGHYHCIFHLEANTKKKVHKNHETLHTLLFKATKAYTLKDFNFHMKELCKMGKSIHTMLTQTVPVEQWAGVHSKHYRRQAMTSNIAESLNSRNKKTRSLPVTTLTEQLRTLSEKWSVKFCTEARNTVSKLATKYHKTIFRRYVKSTKFKVIQSTDYIYKVVKVDIGQSFVVNLGTNTCSCKKFQTDELPCKHAVPIVYKRQLDIRNFSSPYYYNDTLKNTYESVIHPISTSDRMQIPEEISNIVVKRPNRRPKVGRSRTTRYRSRLEKPSGNGKLCRRCRKGRHNKRTCPNMPVVDV